MKRAKPTAKTFCFLLIILCFLPTLLEAEIIVDIKVEGLKNVHSGLVISISGLEIGREFSSVTVKKAIKQIFATDLFEDVRIKSEKKGGGVIAIIEVQEAPLISSIEFAGNKKFKSKKLLEICGLEEGDVGSSRAIFDAQVKIRDAYEEEGYFLVEITAETAEEEGAISIKYVISESKKVKIRSIEILGNHALSDKKLKGKLENKERHWFGPGSFKRDEFETDPDRIIEFYRTQGYPNCKVVSAKAVPDETREWVTLYIEVDEGKKFYFGNVNFEGNEVIETEVLLRGAKFKANDVYSKEKLSKSLEGTYAIYGDLGYLYVGIDLQEEARDSLVDITYRIHEGEPARVHKIIIADNNRTHDKVIRRELTIFPGDILKRKEIIRSQRKIFNLGFFQNMMLDTKPANEEGDIDLIIKVEEKQAGQASLGGSYYPNYGWVGNLGFSTPNFRGLGERLYIKFQKGQRLQVVEAGYHRPWLFDTPMFVGLDLYHTIEEKYWGRAQRTGGKIKVGRPIPRLPYAKGYISYKLERVRTWAEDSTEEWRSATTFEVVRDSRDNFLNPTVGTRNVAWLELSGGLLGGSVDYHKEIIETSTYHRLLGRVILSFRGKLGFLDGYQTPESVPWYERFVLGGIGAWGLRGYHDWSVGPEIGGDVFGGRFASVFTVEVKLAFEENIYPLVFFDVGNAWECFRDANLQDLKRGIGFGFRIEIPMMGLMGFDFGYGLDKEPGGWEFHLQMGATF